VRTGACLALVSALTVSVPDAAGAQEPALESAAPRVETDDARCDGTGRTHSRILASPDRVRQVWAGLEVIRRRNRCRLRWELHTSTNTGRRFSTVTVTEAPPLSEGNGYGFELVAFTDTGNRVLAVQNESLGDWTSRTVVVYDFGTRAVLTQDVNGRVEKLAPDDCPVYGFPIGFVSDDTVALVVASSEDVDDDAFRCWRESRWGLNMRTGELRRLAAAERVMTAGVVLDHPRDLQTSGSRPGP
jgi:hypothetical protein